MPVRIKRLQCTVRVKTGKKVEPRHQDERASRPSLQLAALPAPEPRSETTFGAAPEAASGVQEATETKVQSASETADARAVADRVYDLMREEMLLARRRGIVTRRN